MPTTSTSSALLLIASVPMAAPPKRRVPDGLGAKTRPQRAPIAYVPLLALLLVLAWCGVLVPANAATIPAGHGSGCSLINAIQSANSNTSIGGCVAGSGAADIIDLASACTSGQTCLPQEPDFSAPFAGINAFPVITSNITIKGDSRTFSIPPESPPMRFFHVATGGTLRIEDLSLSGGRVMGADGSSEGDQGRNGFNGHPISRDGKNGTEGSKGDNGEHALGGAIYNDGTLILERVKLSGNSVQGGSGRAGGRGGHGGLAYRGDNGANGEAGGNGGNGGKGGQGGAGGAGGHGRGGAIYSGENATLRVGNSALIGNQAVGGAAGRGGSGGPGGHGGNGGHGGLPGVIGAGNAGGNAGDGNSGGPAGPTPAAGAANGSAIFAHTLATKVEILHTTFVDNEARAGARDLLGAGGEGGWGGQGGIGSDGTETLIFGQIIGGDGGDGGDGGAGGNSVHTGPVAEASGALWTNRNDHSKVSIINSTFSGNKAFAESESVTPLAAPGGRQGALGPRGNCTALNIECPEFGVAGETGPDGQRVPLKPGTATGAGLWVRAGVIRFSTVAGNIISHDQGCGTACGAGIHAGNLRSEATIVADNLMQDDVGGNARQCSSGASPPPVDQGSNLSSDASCASGGAGTQVHTDPKLLPLADNGGFGQTHALPAASPATNAAACDLDTVETQTDQRGVRRGLELVGATPVCEVGAWENIPGENVPIGLQATASVYSLVALPGGPWVAQTAPAFFLLKVTNTGDADMSGLRVPYTISAGSIYLDFVVPFGFNVSGSFPDFVWHVGDLPVGSTKTLNLIIMVAPTLSQHIATLSYSIQDSDVDQMLPAPLAGSAQVTTIPQRRIDVVKEGLGSGTVRATTTGLQGTTLDCGPRCIDGYFPGTAVGLTVEADTGSVFVGWGAGSHADCGNTVPLNAHRNCIAVFDLMPTALTVEVVTVAQGAPGGSIVSTPAGVNCSGSCTSDFPRGTVVVLQPVPDPDAYFVGWSGDADCQDGMVQMNGARTCQARFEPRDGYGEGAVFFTDLDAFSEVVVNQTIFATTAANLHNALEVTSPPGNNDPLGPTLTLPPPVFGGRGFVMHTVEVVPNLGWVFNDNEFPGQTNLLSINDVDNGQDDDFVISFSGSHPTAFGFHVYQNNRPNPRIESLTVYSILGKQLARLDLSTVAFPPGDQYQFLGVVTEVPIGSIVFDEDPTGDDIGLRDLVFGDAAVRQAVSAVSASGIEVSDSVCPTCTSGAKSLAARFSTTEAMRIGQLKLLGSYSGDVLPQQPQVSVRFHSEADGVPEMLLAEYTAVPVYLLGTDLPGTFPFAEYEVRIDLPSPVSLPPGDWFVEVWDDTPALFGWRLASPPGGAFADSETAPGAEWQADTSSGLAFSAWGVNELRVLTVGKAGVGSGTITSPVGYVNCGSSCSASFVDNTFVILNAVADPGSIFVGWGGDCSGVVPEIGFMLSESAACSAYFGTTNVVSVEKVGSGSGTVTSVPAGIQCGADCTEEWTDLTQVILTATPEPGSSFAGWEGNPACANSPFVVQGADVACVARFNLDVLLSISTTGDGSVTGPGGINCPGGSCSAFFPIGTQITLVPVPAAGKYFAGWSGDPNCSSNPFAITADTSCSAHFNDQPHLFVGIETVGTGTVTGPGGINCPGNCVTNVAPGTPVVLHPAPAAGYYFAGWVGSAHCANSFTMPSGLSTSCAARFVEQAQLSPAAVFFNNSAAWEELLAGVEDFSTIGANLVLADEVTSTPTPNTWLGTTLTFPAGAAELRQSLTLRTLQSCTGPNCGWRFEETGTQWSGLAGTLSPNGIIGEKDDFEILIGDERPVTAVGFWVVDADTPPTGVESVTVYGDNDALLGQIDLSAYPLGGNGVQHFIGVATREPIRRLVFVEDAGPDDLALRNLRFGEASVVNLVPAIGVPSGIGEISDSSCCGGSSRAFADPFTLAERALVGQIDLFGAYTNDQHPLLDRIRTNFYSDAAGLPGTPVGTPNVVLESMPRVGLGTITSGFDRSRLSLARSTPVDLSANTWWLSLVDDSASEFLWQREIVFPGAFVARSDGGGAWTQVSNRNLMYQLWGAVAPWTLEVAFAGGGTGTVTSSAGVDCSSALCNTPIARNRVVVLAATPDPGMVFLGWSGDPDCHDGTVTVDQSLVACTATFEPILDLPITIVGQGTVVSDPEGIDCSSSCAGYFPATSAVALTAIPAANYLFDGWSGDADCSDGVVTIDADVTCTASFVAVVHGLDISKTGPGSGTVSSSPAGIDCGLTCSANFNFGTEVILAATPAPGSIFTGWSGHPECKDGVVNMSEDIVCTASFGVVEQTLSISRDGPGTGRVLSAPLGIDCGTSCMASFPLGSVVILTAQPEPGSNFTGWSGDAACASGVVTMNADIACTASFGLADQTLTISKSGSGSGSVSSSPAGIDCGSACVASFPHGTSVTLTATAATGSLFGGWSGDADCSDGVVTMEVNIACTANFELVNHVLNIATAGLGEGTVTSSPAGIDCGTTCAAEFPYGTAVTLTATPAEGSSFEGWSGHADCSDGVVTMQANFACTATFEHINNTLLIALHGLGDGTVSSDPSGIDCGPTCVASFPNGTVVTLTATPAPGSTFEGWSSDADCSDGVVTMNQQTHCAATFERGPQTLSVAFSGTGSGMVESQPDGILCSGVLCSADFPYGETVTLTPTAATDSVFKGWSGDCSGSAPAAVVMSEPRSCVARFDIALDGPWCRMANVAIPDNAFMADDLVISTPGVLENLDLALEIEHSFVGDLAVTLTHMQTGTTVTLIDRPGPGCPEDDVVVLLDDDAPLPVNGQCAASLPSIDGVYSPVGPLDAFLGEAFQGTWTLDVADEASGEVGTLVGWCLRPFPAPMFLDGFETIQMRRAQPLP